MIKEKQNLLIQRKFLVSMAYSINFLEIATLELDDAVNYYEYQ